MPEDLAALSATPQRKQAWRVRSHPWCDWGKEHDRAGCALPNSASWNVFEPGSFGIPKLTYRDDPASPQLQAAMPFGAFAGQHVHDVGG